MFKFVEHIFLKYHTMHLRSMCFELERWLFWASVDFGGCRGMSINREHRDGERGIYCLRVYVRDGEKNGDMQWD